MVAFSATVRQHYRLKSYDLLVVEEDYDGDVGPGDVVTVELADGTEKSARVRDVAWGSAMHAEKNPPLTLILEGLGGAEVGRGAAITGPG